MTERGRACSAARPGPAVGAARPGKRGPQPGTVDRRHRRGRVGSPTPRAWKRSRWPGWPSELGFTTMSLYRYVASKDELLQLMWNGSAQGAEELELRG